MPKNWTSPTRKANQDVGSDKQADKKLLMICLGIIALMVASLVFVGVDGFRPLQMFESKSELRVFNECLANNGLVVYGDATCKGSETLLKRLGGIENAEPVYIDCNEQENKERCDREANAGYVPEIQINGEVYSGPNSLKKFSEKTGCPLPENYSGAK